MNAGSKQLPASVEYLKELDTVIVKQNLEVMEGELMNQLISIVQVEMTTLYFLAL